MEDNPISNTLAARLGQKRIAYLMKLLPAHPTDDDTTALAQLISEDPVLRATNASMDRILKDWEERPYGPNKAKVLPFRPRLG